MSNLKEKMVDGIDAVYEMTLDTFKFIPNATIKDCFPADCYRMVTIDGKDYRLHINLELQEI